MPIETQLDLAEYYQSAEADLVRVIFKVAELDSLEQLRELPESKTRVVTAILNSLIPSLINSGIEEKAIDSELSKRRTAGKGLDRVGLFSEYVRLSRERFFIERQLNGNFVNDPDQLLAEWYVSDEFSALMQTHAAFAKKVAVTGAGL